jgi:hypothetical protein
MTHKFKKCGHNNELLDNQLLDKFATHPTTEPGMVAQPSREVVRLLKQHNPVLVRLPYRAFLAAGLWFGGVFYAGGGRVCHGSPGGQVCVAWGP